MARALVKRAVVMTTAVMEADSAIKNHESVTYLPVKMTLRALPMHTVMMTEPVKTGVESARRAQMSLTRMVESSSVMRRHELVSLTARAVSQMKAQIAVRRAPLHNVTLREANS